MNRQMCFRIVTTLLAMGLSFATPDFLRAQKVVVDVTPSHVVNSFSPMSALGAGVDRLKGPNRLRVGNAETVLGEPLLKETLSAGWQTVTYRQNTELQVEGWHWNPRGTWSNEAKNEGYFTGSAELGEMIQHSFAYPLPHRGFSVGDGTEWGRLTDGDEKTYWKSNPYLTKAFTGEDDSLHSQWVMIDLGKKVDVNAIRIAWAEPYARKYAVQFWTGELEPFYDGTTKGTWQTFPQGAVTEGKGGTVTLKLVSWNIPVRYLRIWMTESSNTCDTHGADDPRNCVGYAISEIYAGTLADDGKFTDVVKHLNSRKQTTTWPSSVDPWHAASDMDESKGDQIGFDFFFHSGVTRGLPTMVPIAMLYTTPEDAAAEIAYLYKRHYPISWIEMGEEADGQHMLPEDYGALYLQFATAIHKLVPEAKLGGPAFEGTLGDVEVWPDAQGRSSWLGRFLDYLKAHDRLNDYTFFSFEHYPFSFDECHLPWTDLYKEPEIVKHILQVWKDDGLPANFPTFMTEGNIGGGAEVKDLMGGLWLADYVGAFLTGGGSGTYYFHYVPAPLRAKQGCADADSSLSALLYIDNDYKFKGYFAQYFATQLITKEWTQPVDAAHKVFPVASDLHDGAGNLLITAYAVERPDGQWAIMLINKDHDKPHAVKVVFADTDRKTERKFFGTVQRSTFGAAEFKWHADEPNGHADPDGPPSKSTMDASADGIYQLPKASIVVLRGKLAD